MDRRPLAARDWRPTRQAAAFVALLGITPNAISATGLVAGLAAGGVLAGTALELPGPVASVAWSTAALLIALRGLCNILDGMVAVNGKQCSPTGALWNEVPDRVSDIAMLAGAGLAHGGHAGLGAAAALGAVFVAYVRAMGAVAGARQDFCGPMAKPQRMAVIAGACAYCAVTPVHLQTIGDLGVMTIALALVMTGCVVTAVRRVVRAARELELAAVASGSPPCDRKVVT